MSSVNLVKYILDQKPTPEQVDNFLKMNRSEELDQENDVHQTPYSASLETGNLSVALHLIQKMGKEGVERENSQGLTPLLFTLAAGAHNRMPTEAITLVVQSLFNEGANASKPSTQQFPKDLFRCMSDIPQRTTPFWIALECTFTSIGLALSFRAKDAAIAPELSNWGQKRKEIVERIFEIKSKHFEPVKQAFQPSELTAEGISGALDLLPPELKDLIKQSLFPQTINPLDEGVGLFLNACQLMREYSSSLDHYLKTCTTIHHMMSDVEIRHYKNTLAFIRTIIQRLQKIENTEGSPYHQLFHSGEDELKMGNQTFLTLQGLTKKADAFQTAVDTLPSIKEKAIEKKRFQDRRFWIVVALVVGTFVFFMLREYLAQRTRTPLLK